MMAIRSPGATPAAIRPAASAVAWSANSRQVTVRHSPAIFLANTGWSGDVATRAMRSSVTLASAGTAYLEGSDHSLRDDEPVMVTSVRRGPGR